ncbi:hypothetical protein [Ancylobacter mangrovi]|uniref:hypothetical protein n=1 Tax=Ancylobacter mangrovi TaxID=2972472 RepID=UPI002161DAF7|nr:hypothetical protein [Ancylobacter mangrovi]MCS0504738.1 hypothetical protein [Ancylobacter mangrovi]
MAATFLREGARDPHPAARAFVVACAALALLACLALPAAAHHRRTGSEASGLPIPNLTHGEMAVVARYAGAIRDLAGSPIRTDPTFWRLNNFVELQRTFCLWLMVPGSIDDEASPFNECAHAYLAGLRALLGHMEGLPGAKAAAQALTSTMQIEMIRNGALFQLCQYSEEGFRTGEIIKPDWSAVPLHFASMVTIGGIGILMASGVGLLWPRRRG